jgi:hypothetical protein
MNALNIGDILFVHGLRKRGFLVSVTGLALALLALAGITAFGLGREMLMIREAAFGTLYVAAFLGSLLFGVQVTGPSGSRWFAELGTRPVGEGSLAAGIVFGSALTALWVALALVPFLAASLMLFHGKTPLALLCIALGGVGLFGHVGAARLGLSPLSSRFLPVLLATALAVPALTGLPAGAGLFPVLALSLGPILLTGLLTGACLSMAPGPSGLLLAMGFFGLANLRAPLVASGSAGKALAFLPDLSSLNPSLAVAGEAPLAWGDALGSLLYTVVAGIGILLVAVGIATHREHQASVDRSS